MVEQMDKEGFGNCTNQYECEAVCPKSIKSEFISDLNRQYATASVKEAIGQEIPLKSECPGDTWLFHSPQNQASSVSA